MSSLPPPAKPAERLHLLDFLLYLLAGSSMTIISISFLLWLRF